MSKNKVTGILLSGGKSSRFGSDKALAEINGIPFLVKLTTIMLNSCEEVLVSVQNLERLELYSKVIQNYFNGILPKNLSFQIDSDDFKSHGPVRGLYSCLEKVQNSLVIVVPVDMPFVSNIHLDFLRELYETKYIQQEVLLIGWLPDDGKIPYPFFIGQRDSIFEILINLKTFESVPLKKIYDAIPAKILICPSDSSFLANFNYPPKEDLHPENLPFQVKQLVFRYRNAKPFGF